MYAVGLPPHGVGTIRQSTMTALGGEAAFTHIQVMSAIPQQLKWILAALYRDTALRGNPSYRTTVQHAKQCLSTAPCHMLFPEQHLHELGPNLTRHGWS